MKVFRTILAIVFTFTITEQLQASIVEQQSFQTDSIKQSEWVDSVLNSLTIREKIAQLFMVAAFSNKDQKHIDEITSFVENEKIGGLCFFQGGPVRQALLTNTYQSISKVPLLISIDAEWGLGMRLDSAFSYPRQMMLGAAADPELVYQMKKAIHLFVISRTTNNG